MLITPTGGKHFKLLAVVVAAEGSVAIEGKEEDADAKDCASDNFI